MWQLGFESNVIKYKVGWQRMCVDMDWMSTQGTHHFTGN